MLDIEEDSDQYLYLLMQSLRQISGNINAMNMPQGLDPYMNILSHNLVKGREEDFENAITLLEIIVNATDEEFIEPYATRILGLLVRTLNYRRDFSIKKKMIELIDFLMDQPSA